MMINTSMGMVRRALAGVNTKWRCSLNACGMMCLALWLSAGTSYAQSAPPLSGQVKLVGPNVTGPSIALSVGDQSGDTNSATSAKPTNTVVSAIQQQLKLVVEAVEATTKQMADANRAGPKEQAAAVEALADRIDGLAKKDLADDSPFLAQADQLIKKMDGQIKLAQDRAGDPNILPPVQAQYSETAKRIRENLTQLRSAREAVNGVRSDLARQAQGLRERKDFLGFLADSEVSMSAADAFKQCLTDIHNFCRRLEATIAGLDGNTPLVVEGKIIGQNQ